MEGSEVERTVISEEESMSPRKQDTTGHRPGSQAHDSSSAADLAGGLRRSSNESAGGAPHTAAAQETASSSPPGLNDARHADAQQTAHRAEVLRRGVFPALMASALDYDRLFRPEDYQVYLDGLLRDAGNPRDPIEVMLLQQLALVHFRIGQLHDRAGKAQGIEAVKMYNAAATRLMGEFRRTALAVRVFRGRLPEDTAASKRKLHRLAH